MLCKYSTWGKSRLKCQVAVVVSHRLCHPAPLAAAGAATPRCDPGRQARSRAKGLQAPGAGAGTGLCADVYAYTVTEVSLERGGFFFSTSSIWMIYSKVNRQTGIWYHFNSLNQHFPEVTGSLSSKNTLVLIKVPFSLCPNINIWNSALCDVVLSLRSHQPKPTHYQD